MQYRCRAHLRCFLNEEAPSQISRSHLIDIKERAWRRLVCGLCRASLKIIFFFFYFVFFLGSEKLILESHFRYLFSRINRTARLVKILHMILQPTMPTFFSVSDDWLSNNIRRDSGGDKQIGGTQDQRSLALYVLHNSPRFMEKINFIATRDCSEK